MTFDELLAQVMELLQRQGRVSYGALKRRFALDDDYLQDLKDELIDAQQVARDEDGKVLVWVGVSLVSGSKFQISGSQPPSPSPQSSDSRPWTLDPRRDAGERRQLTVMFCDLVGSTALSTQLDPEELREVIQAYREICATVIRRFEGHLAKYIGDELLVYFGYPLAHEDDAQRAVRAGLSILAELPQLNVRLQSSVGVHSRAPLQIRIGIHTGLVVAGEMGVGDQPEPLAIVGETPNLAARLQQEAQPNAVVISAATYHLIQGYFECADLGLREVKGAPAPLQVYRVLGESGVQSRLEVAASRGLTPLVGREPEVRLLLECWEQVKEGQGQVVLLSGEAGIGKSRLVRVLRERIAGETQGWLECRCSPYHQNSALYPIIDLLQRVLGFIRDDSPEEKLRKLEVRAHSRAPLQTDTIPLLAHLLSLPLPERYPPLNLTPQRQKQKTLEALLTWLLAEAERQPVAFIVEDPHWADPSTLEFLGLLIEQVPTARLLTILAFRPEFTPPWPSRSHLTHFTLQRLPRKHVEEIVEKLTGDKALPAAVVQQIVAKTDGVPLFVEELTKMVVESGLHVGAQHAAPLLLGIPATLHDALMARLDRLGPAKEIAQLGAMLGREFNYELLHAVSPLDEAALQQGLRQLVEAELLYQRGLPPQTTYLFKHALIQDAAYQSLLKSTRQQYHQQIAQVLEERFPETKETQPELLAHHYTEAGLLAQAIPYWRQAGQKAVQRSAHVEAISHLTKGLELLKTLPDTAARARQELTLQLSLGASLMATKGFAATEVEQTYTRAQEICLQVGEPLQVAQVLYGRWVFNNVRGSFTAALALGEQFLTVAHRQQDSTLSLVVQAVVGLTLFFLGEFDPAQAHLDQAGTFYDPEHHRDLAYHMGQDPGLMALGFAAETLWHRGYPDQALERVRHALSVAQALAHPLSLVAVLSAVAFVHLFRRESQEAHAQAEALLTLAHEHGFAFWLDVGTSLQGWALVERAARSGAREQGEAGLVQLREGLAAERSTEAEIWVPLFLGALAQGYAQGGQAEEGLRVIAEALAMVEKNEERWTEADLYRLKGELTLQQSRASLEQVSDKSKASQDKSEDTSPQPLTSNPQTEAEACFLKAIEIACKQQAKSLELRATMSLARLWQQQGKTAEARELLAPVYNWFTEGFDTKDLQEAKALLEELSG